MVKEQEIRYYKIIDGSPKIIIIENQEIKYAEWICACGYPSPEHALYCSQCGASKEEE